VENTTQARYSEKASDNSPCGEHPRCLNSIGTGCNRVYRAANASANMPSTCSPKLRETVFPFLRSESDISHDLLEVGHAGALRGDRVHEGGKTPGHLFSSKKRVCGEEVGRPEGSKE